MATDTDYAGWLTAAQNPDFTPPVDAQGNKMDTSPITTTGPDGNPITTGRDTLTHYASPSNYSNVPVGELISPFQAPSAWAITNPNDRVYTGETEAATLSRGQAIQGLADKFGIKQKRGKLQLPIEDLVVNYLKKIHGVDTGSKTPNWKAAVALAPHDFSAARQPGESAAAFKSRMVDRAAKNLGASSNAFDVNAGADDVMAGIKKVGKGVNDFAKGMGPAIGDVETAGLNWLTKPDGSKAGQTRNGGKSKLMQDGNSGGMVWVHAENNKWVPDQDQGGANGAAAKPGQSSAKPGHPHTDYFQIAKALHVTVGANEDPLLAIARAQGVNTSVDGKVAFTTVGQAAQGMRAYFNNPDAIRGLQEKLFQAGKFTYGTFAPGQWDTHTQEAVGNLLQDTADANKIDSKGRVTQNHGKGITWEDMLKVDTDNVGKNGGIAEIMKRNRGTIPQATQSQLLSPAVSGFQSQLGRAPTAAEMGDLTQKFDTAQVNKYAGMDQPSLGVDSNTGIQSAPGIPTPTAAAAQYAQSNNHSEFFAHSMLNARSMLADLLNGGGSIEQTGARAAVQPQ